MKRTLSLIISLFLFVRLFAYEPLTSWPYVYEEFTKGRVISFDGKTIEYESLNINLISSRVHYIENGIIMECKPETVSKLEINGATYICVGARMMKVIAESQNSAVVLRTSIDYDAMNKANIGYGKSSMASTQSISVSVLSEQMSFSVNKSMEDVSRDKYDGEPLVLKEEKGILYKNLFVLATKRDVLNALDESRDKVKEFLKTERIKFRKEEDLLRLIDFISSL